MQSTCQRCDSRNTEHVERLSLIHRLIKHVRQCFIGTAVVTSLPNYLKLRIFSLYFYVILVRFASSQMFAVLPVCTAQVSVVL